MIITPIALDYVFDVMDYGAAGGAGTVDDTAAIQAAATAWMAQGYGELKFPPGKYKITGSIIFQPPTAGATYDKPMVITGSGATILVNVTAVPGFWFRGPSATKTWWNTLVFRDLNFDADAGTPTDVILLDDSDTYALAMYEFSLENLRVVNFPSASNGITMINKFEFQLINCYVRQDVPVAAPTGDCIRCYYSAVGSSEQVSSTNFINCQTAYGLRGLYLHSTQDARIMGGTYNGAWEHGIYGHENNWVHIDDPHLEGNWRGGTPPDTNEGGFEKASIFLNGGGCFVHLSNYDYSVNALWGCELVVDGRSVVIYDGPVYGAGQVLSLLGGNVVTLGIDPTDLTLIPGSAKPILLSLQGAELTDELTSITHTAPTTPDYALQDLVQNTGFGFVTKDEGNTVLSVILNLQTRVNELEARLVANGLLVDAD